MYETFNYIGIVFGNPTNKFKLMFLLHLVLLTVIITGIIIFVKKIIINFFYFKLLITLLY